MGPGYFSCSIYYRLQGRDFPTPNIVFLPLETTWFFPRMEKYKCPAAWQPETGWELQLGGISIQKWQ